MKPPEGWRECQHLDGPITDLDTWRATALLIQRHGVEDAAPVAAQTADVMLAKGDEQGYANWKTIVDAVLELRRDKPEGESVN